MRMPFGKHKGQEIDDLPTDYLRWMIKNLTDLSYSLRTALEDQLEIRGVSYESASSYRHWAPAPPPPGGWQRPPPPPPPSPPPPKTPVNWGIAEEIVEAGFKTLAKRHHPDSGGDLEKMKAVNVAADWLRAQLQPHLAGSRV